METSKWVNYEDVHWPRYLAIGGITIFHVMWLFLEFIHWPHQRRWVAASQIKVQEAKAQPHTRTSQA